MFNNLMNIEEFVISEINDILEEQLVAMGKEIDINIEEKFNKSLFKIVIGFFK